MNRSRLSVHSLNEDLPEPLTGTGLNCLWHHSDQGTRSFLISRCSDRATHEGQEPAFTWRAGFEEARAGVSGRLER